MKGTLFSEDKEREHEGEEMRENDWKEKREKKMQLGCLVNFKT